MSTQKGMNSAKLSKRDKQPGNDRTFITAEKNFITIANKVLDLKIYKIVDHPPDLEGIFHR